MAYRTGPARLGHHLALGLLLLLTLAFSKNQAAPALAAPSDASLADVFSSLHITAEPADYVVIVDTSASMADNNLYQRVQSGLDRMAQALTPQDRVAVITFDSTPTLRRPLRVVGSNRGDIVSSLPSAPKGQATDIGRAIASALDLMQGSNLRSRAAVMLFTDGKIDTDKNSPYATVASTGWSGLKQRASSLQGSHDIAPIAIALTSNTDAAVLKEVFNNVTVVSSTDLGSYLSQVSTEVMKAAAITRLKGHLADPVTASLDLSAPVGGSSGGKLVLHNSNPMVPIELTGLAVSSDSGPLKTTGVKEPVIIAPDGTSTSDVTVATSERAGAPGMSYHVVGTVSSPWQNVITHDLGLTWSAKLASNSAQLTRPAPVAASSPAATTTTKPHKSAFSGALVVAGVLVLLAIVVALVVRVLRGVSGPQLTGTISVLRNGRVIDERLLRGRTMSFHLTDPPAGITLRGTKNREGQPGVSVSVAVGRDRAVRTLFEGDTLESAGLVITYTTDRTRMLRLIGTD